MTEERHSYGENSAQVLKWSALKTTDELKLVLKREESVSNQNTRRSPWSVFL